MFGLDSTLLAIIALSGLSAGALAYAFLFRTIADERKADRRLETVKRADTDRSVVKATRDRQAEIAKRRKNVQDSLKDLEDRQKAKDVNVKKAATLKHPDRPGWLQLFLTANALPLSAAPFRGCSSL
jgi:tight adherence protein B